MSDKKEYVMYFEGKANKDNTQNLNEFELHLYAVLGLPIPGITISNMASERPIPGAISTDPVIT